MKLGLKKKCYPKVKLNNVLEITEEFLHKNNLKAIITDVDNTLMDYDGNILEGINEWIDRLQKVGIKICILTNTRKPQKAEKISKMLNNIPYVYFAKKPLKGGFKRAKKKLNMDNNENIAVVGDQIMTDILGANRNHMFSILVSPLGKNEILPTRINRRIEKILFGKSNQDEL